MYLNIIMVPTWILDGLGDSALTPKGMALNGMGAKDRLDRIKNILYLYQSSFEV